MAQPDISADSASARIAERIRTLILSGELIADQRLPGEQDLAHRFGVSRPTVREALKRLAAQNLIRTRRGASGGSFIKRIGADEAQDQVVSVATLFLSMNDLDAGQVAEARLALLSAVAPLAVARAGADDVAAMRREIEVQSAPGTTDEAFCASDVAFLRRFVDAAGNPMLTLAMAGLIEAVQPLLNMITFRTRDRREITLRHRRLVGALERGDTPGVVAEFAALSDYSTRLIGEAQAVRAARAGRA